MPAFSAKIGLGQSAHTSLQTGAEQYTTHAVSRSHGFSPSPAWEGEPSPMITSMESSPRKDHPLTLPGGD